MDIKKLIHPEPLHVRDQGVDGYRQFLLSRSTSATRRGRIFTPEQRCKLLSHYDSDPYPDLQKRRELAEEMKTTARSTHNQYMWLKSSIS
ncbi:hypothetical protein PROFUN_08908 [Planoprotostelium fungivorum]|uniref:Homeobox domain-containing protein n=1 Tax=Planoprotostelium fungivorum TaxID=1890364 RepID=A0A2P6NIW0_9EUKA|nr:hypothetical protein PROFUN_08908 [Planoprotostelium fungivorum]